MEDSPGPSGRPELGASPFSGRGGNRVLNPKLIPRLNKAEREAEERARGRAKVAAYRERKRSAASGAGGGPAEEVRRLCVRGGGGDGALCFFKSPRLPPKLPHLPGPSHLFISPTR